MRKLVTAMILAAAVVTPAFAQSFIPSQGTGNIAPPPNNPFGTFRYPETDSVARQTAADQQGLASYALSPRAGRHGHRQLRSDTQR